MQRFNPHPLIQKPGTSKGKMPNFLENFMRKSGLFTLFSQKGDAALDLITVIALQIIFHLCFPKKDFA
jgi:hypothetical protein